MDRSQLLQHFDSLAETPEAIPKLRELALQLAVPIAEQQRIVAKVNELMRWCNALEARLAAAETAGTHLLDATLRQLLAA